MQRLSDVRVQAALAALTYLIWGLFVTRPVFAHLGTQIYGTGGDDNWSLIAFYREMVEHRLNPFEPSVIPDWGAPEGLKIGSTVNLVQWPVVTALYLLTAAVGEVAAVNLFVLAGFVLNGTAMFLFARRLTGHAGAAFVAGLAFAFMPRMVVWAQNHQYFAHGWVLILMSWRLFELSDRPTPRNGALAGLAAVFALSWNPYYVLFGTVAYFVFVVADLVRVLARRVPLRPLLDAHLVSGAIVIAVFAVIGLVARGAAAGSGAVTRPISEAYVYSARLHEYLLPDARNPIFGGLTDDYIFRNIHGSGYGEINSYLGWSVILLALVAIVAAIRRRIEGDRLRYVWTMVGVAVAGLLFSAPPTAQVGPVRLYFPPWLVYEVTSTWRAFARILPVIALGLCVVAAYGLARLLAGRTPRVQAIAVALVAAVVAADLYVAPFQASATLPEPAIYDTLNRQPRGGLVAVYPLNPDKIPLYEARLNQDLHDRPVINGYGDGSDQENRALAIHRLDDPRTPGRLALLGVRWVVLDERPPPRPDVWVTGFPSGRGMRLIDRRDGYSLWEVTAAPARSWVAAGEGFHYREGDRRREFHWLRSTEGNILVHASCGECTGTLTFEAASFAVPRKVTLRQDGRTLLSTTVTAAHRPLSAPVRIRRGRATVQIEASPGPQNVRRTTGEPDDRDLAVQVVELRFEG